MITTAPYEGRKDCESEYRAAGYFSKTVEYAEQQGASATIAWLKSIRIANLLEQMREIDFRKDNAMEELKTLTESVEQLLNTNRGGDKGIHGFIGERAHVYITNAWGLMYGEVKVCELIDDNGMTDYLENGISIQQKACRSNGWLGLDHVLRHREKYPEFVGRYQIPKDFFDTYMRIGSMSEKEAGKLCLHEWNLWHEIQEIKQAGIEIEPMKVSYDEIQRDRIYDTIERNKAEIQAKMREMKDQAIELHKPTVKAGIQTAAISSATEGILAGAVKIVEKRLEGKEFKEFDSQDLKEIGLAAAEGSIRGAVRGTVVYIAENCTAIPGVVAGAAVTVTFESAQAVKRYCDGKITREECVGAVEKSVVVAAAGGLGAKLGRKIIPVPVVGEVIGGFLFSFVASKAINMIDRLRESAPIGADVQPV